jgi:hypothetical protein
MALALGLSACAGTRGATATERPGRDFAGKTLAVILPDSTQIDVRNASDLFLAFPRENNPSPKAVLAQEFGEAFYAGLAASLDYVTPVKVPDSVGPAPASYRIDVAGAGSLTLPAHAYSAPTQAWLASRGVEADLVLVIGPVASSTGRNDIISPKFGGAITVNFLAVDGWYLLWDYAAGKALAQGRFRPTVEYKRDLGAREWLKAFDKSVEAVGEATPFKGPKWYHR